MNSLANAAAPYPFPPSTLPPSMLNASMPAQVPLSMPNVSMPPAEEDTLPATIQPIIHPGHAPREDEELVGVIVTICSGSSYDPLFTQVPQLAGEGKRVATYAVSPGGLPQ